MFVILLPYSYYVGATVTPTPDITGATGSLAVVLTPVNTNQVCYPPNNNVAQSGVSPLTVKQPPPNPSTTVVGGIVNAAYYTVCSYVQTVGGVLLTPTQPTFTQSPLGLVYNGYVLHTQNQGVINFGPNVCSSGSTAPTQLNQIALGVCTPIYAGANLGGGNVIGSSMYYSFNAGSVGSGAGAYAQAPIGKTGIYGVSNQYISANYYTGSTCSGTPMIVYTWASNAATCQSDFAGVPTVVQWSATPYQLPSSLTAVVVST